MAVIRTVKQRMVLRRKPRAFPVGTIRSWQGGTFVKVGRNAWQRAKRARAKGLVAAIPKAYADMRGGLPGLARALQTADRVQAAPIAQQVVNQMSTWDARNPPTLLELPAALAGIMAMNDPALTWWLYSARRIAAFNDGMVDIGMVSNMAERAERFHGGKMPDHDMSKASYSGPRTVADINLASWQQFFDEGGSLNQPAWLESNRLKDLRRQFTLLANMHRGK